MEQLLRLVTPLSATLIRRTYDVKPTGYKMHGRADEHKGISTQITFPLMGQSGQNSYKFRGKGEQVFSGFIIGDFRARNPFGI